MGETIEEQRERVRDRNISQFIWTTLLEVFDDSWRYALKRVRKDYHNSNSLNEWQFSHDIEVMLSSRSFGCSMKTLKKSKKFWVKPIVQEKYVCKVCLNGSGLYVNCGFSSSMYVIMIWLEVWHLPGNELSCPLRLAAEFGIQSALLVQFWVSSL